MIYPASTHEVLTTELWQYNYSTMLWRKYNKTEASLEDTEGDPFTRLALQVALGDLLKQWRTQGFFSGGGVQQIQLRTERTGIWGR